VAVLIAPRSAAVPSSATGTSAARQRDQHIEIIHAQGRMAWQKATGYVRRSHADTTMVRYKPIIGSSRRARTLPAQKAETKIACSVLNRMAAPAHTDVAVRRLTPPLVSSKCPLSE
jgi:hypothetical protein